MLNLDNAKILVTGGLGFIGSNFIEYLMGKYRNLHILNCDKAGHGSRELYGLMSGHTIEFGDNLYTWVYLDLANVYQNTHIRRLLVGDKFDYIFHFAAESHVDRSIDGPAPFIENNVMGMVNLLEAIRKYQPNTRLINVSCYDEQTQALTKNGIKNYWEITTDDEVLSINEEGVMEWKQIEKVIIQDYDGDMIHFKSPRVDLLVTPNHRMFFNERFGSNSLSIDTAENVMEYDRKVFLPKGTIPKNDYVDDVYDEEWAEYYLYGIYIGDGCSDITEKIVKNKSGFSKKDRMNIRNSKGQFIKATEHERGDVENAISKGRRIFIHVPTGDKARKNTEKALNILNIKWTKIQKNSTYDYIYTSDEKFYDSVQRFGKKSTLKKIPIDMLSNMTYKQAKAIFYGLIDSDGSYSKEGKPLVLNTSSFELLQSVLNLASMLGYSPRYRTRKCLSYLNGRKIEGSSYCIYFRKNNVILNSNIVNMPYSGKIWCLKVKDNKNFIVLRNGICSISGNTDEVFGHLKAQQQPFTERSPFAPRSPYSASKASADLIANSYVTTYGLDIVTTHCCNNFGPHQADEKFIPTVVRHLIKNEKIPLYGTGENVREWIFVDDHNKSLLEIAERGLSGQRYNIGSGVEYSNYNLICEIIKNFYPDMSAFDPNHYIKYVEDRKGHDFRYAIESVQYFRDFELSDFNKSLALTIDHYKVKYTK